MDSSVERVRLTPADREDLRKSQYKSGKSSTTPEWRSSYRMRCKDRLTKSRERLVSLFRNLDSESPGGGSPGSSGVESSSPGSMAAGRSEVQPAASGHMDIEDPVKVLELSVKEAMMEEWEEMRTENLQLPSLSSSRKRVVPFPDMTDLDTPRRKSPYLSSLSSSEDEFDSEDVNSILTVIEELTQELILEEQAMLVQYQERSVEADRRLQEESIICPGSDSENSVLCPICQKNYLLQDVRNIYCVCGMQINTIHDGLTLGHLQEQLETCVSQHSVMCTGRPVFSLECTLGIQNIIMNCTSCDFMFVIL